MLLPQVAEDDVFMNGNYVDDINSVAEYVQQNLLQFDDETPEDEDDDNGQNFSAGNTLTDIYLNRCVILQMNESENRAPVYNWWISNHKLLKTSFDVWKPPPRAF